MLVLMGRLILLLDVIKDTFKDFSSKEKDIIELYSKVDMLIIDDLGTERISSWALEKINIKDIFKGKIIPGVEFSTVFDGVMFHLLAYDFEYKKLNNFLKFHVPSE